MPASTTRHTTRKSGSASRGIAQPTPGASRIGFRIAYPDAWQDFGPLRVSATGHFENTVTAWEYGTGREWARQGRPIDWSV